MSIENALSFLFSLLLFLSYNNVCHCTAISTDNVPSSVTASAAATQYWNRVVGTNRPLPPLLMSHLGDLSPLDLVAAFNSVNIMMVTSDGEEKAVTKDSKSIADFVPLPNRYNLGSRNTGAIRKTEATNGKPISGFVHFQYQYNHDDSKAGKEAEAIDRKPSPGFVHFQYQYTRGDSKAMKEAEGADTKPTSGFVHFQYQYDVGMVNDHSVSKSTRMAMNQEVENLRGFFFMNEQLKKGATMLMPNVRDENPQLKFLPRSIATEIPFSIEKIREIFGIQTDAKMAEDVAKGVTHCGMEPNKGETKRCVTSAEDMIDYVVESLGLDRNLVAKSSKNSKGFGGYILIGEVTAVDDRKSSTSVSCHKPTFPYLMYSCHHVHQTKLYEAEIIDPKTKEVINVATILCHLDTTDWSPNQYAFMVTGGKPGVEMCHWIYEWDMAWTTVDG